MDDRRERNTGRSGRESGSKRKIFRRTVFLMLVCGVGLFIPLIGQLWNIAIVHHEEYQAEAVEQQTRDVEVAAFRGSIYDSSGDVLAMSATVYNLILSPNDLEKSVSKKDFTDEEGNLDQAAYEAAVAAKQDQMVRKTTMPTIVPSRSKISQASTDSAVSKLGGEIESSFLFPACRTVARSWPTSRDSVSNCS